MASIVCIPFAFMVATVVLYYFAKNLPVITSTPSDDNSTEVTLGFPSSLEELNSLANFLSRYKAEYYSYVFFLFSSAYLYKQTFSIPGSFFLNVLAGAIFGFRVGFPLICLLTAFGATNCFLMSKYCGREYILHFIPDKIAMAQSKIEENTDSLFFFLLFLRLFPMAPNWFINVAAPIVGVPVHLFFFSVLIGLMPYNFVCIHTGCVLSQIDSLDDVFTTGTLLKLLGIATVALVPGLLLKKYHMEQQKKKL